MDPAIREFTDTAASIARNALDSYSGLISNEDAVKGIWGAFDAWILQKLEPSGLIASSSERLRKEATHLDRLDGYGGSAAIDTQKRAVAIAIDDLKRAIVENGRLTDEAKFLF